MSYFLNPLQIDFTIGIFLLIVSGSLLCTICYKLIKSSNLIESLILMSLFSLFISVCYLFMDAPDVAMTEVALGACLSTCVLLNIIRITGEDIIPTSKGKKIAATFLCIIFIVLLIYAGIEIDQYGSADAAIHSHVSKYYVENTNKDISIPSIVAAILASYRGFDTLGETTVILIAGIGVTLILANGAKKNA